VIYQIEKDGLDLFFFPVFSVCSGVSSIQLADMYTVNINNFHPRSLFRMRCHCRGFALNALALKIIPPRITINPVACLIGASPGEPPDY
jgi:hypothetical protein